MKGAIAFFVLVNVLLASTCTSVLIPMAIPERVRKESNDLHIFSGGRSKTCPQSNSCDLIPVAVLG